MSTHIEVPSGPQPFWGTHRHTVQFYEREEFLYGAVADFLAKGIAAGDPAVVIATEEHCRGFAEALRARGFDPTADEVLLLDARQVLSTFMRGEQPDPDAFRTAMAAVLEPRSGGHLRAYGEMVDILWRDGKREAALRLEELWNDLADFYPFSLLCAYAIGNFYKESDTALFDAICATHTRTEPTERYLEVADSDERAAEITRLQQRALALEHEIEHRKELERDNAFLLEATTRLHQSLDCNTRLSDLTDLVVPRLADWCAVDLLRDDGSQKRVSESGAEEEIDGTERKLTVPLQLGERVLGVLHLANAKRPFTPNDRRLAGELAGRAALAVENARLYQAAQTANRTKDEFLATLSHELRTPLTAILGWARMLTLGNLDAETMRTAVDTIERSAKTQAELIDDLLDLSRVVTGKLALQRDLVDVRAVVAEAVQTLQLAAEARGIRFEVREPAHGAVINGDPTRLQQIVWNLLSNAIKFSHAGSVVNIDLERGENEVSIVVRDRGRGIAAEFLPHVFEPFRQADSTSTRTHGGLGLGLAIVKYLAELHGGSVRAESEGEGHGATFAVTLPLATAGHAGR